MIKFIDLLENKEYKIELKSGKSMTKYLNDTEYNNLVANMNSPKGTVKSIELTGNKIDNEPKEVPKGVKVDSDPNRPLMISTPTMLDIILSEEVYSKKPNIITRVSPFIRAYMGAAEVNPEEIGNYLRKRASENNILHSEDKLFENAYRRYKKDEDVVDRVTQDIGKVVIGRKDKLSTSDSDIKIYLQYWESKYNPYRKDDLYDDYIKFLKTKINPFK